MTRIGFISDEPTRLMGYMIGGCTTTAYAMAAALPGIGTDLGATRTQLGLCGIGMAVGAIVAGVLHSWLVRMAGRRAVAWGGMLVMCIGTVVIAVSPALLVTVVGYALATGGATGPVYVSGAELKDHHGKAGPAAVTRAFGMGTLVTVVAAFPFTMIMDRLGWRLALTVPLAVCVLVWPVGGGVWFPQRSAPAKPERLATPPPRCPWRVAVAGVALLAMLALEFCFTLWGAPLLSQRTGLDTGVASTGVMGLFAGVGIGRYAAYRLVRRFQPWAVLVGTLLVALGGWVLLWTGTHPVVAYAGLVVAGTGIGAHFPLGLTQFMAASGSTTTAASREAIIWAGIGLGCGPVLLGSLADNVGMHGAFLLAPGLVLVAIAAVVLSAQRGSPSTASSPIPD